MTEHPQQDRGGVDVVANLFTPEVAASRPEWTAGFHRRKNGLDDQIVAGTSVPEMLAAMDAAGIDQTLLLGARLGRRGLPGSWELDPRAVVEVAEAHPDRFYGLLGLNPYDSMAGVRELERMVVDHGFVGAHLYPHWFDLPPDDPAWYPFYAKCAELGVPVQIQVGYSRVYAPQQPAESHGRPECIDRIACLMPELTIVGIHVGWPWTDEMIAVADKHDNVFIGTDRHRPSRWPVALLDYLRGPGRTKVLFGTDFPVVPYDVAARELGELGLDAETRRALLGDNARRIYRLP